MKFLSKKTLIFAILSISILFLTINSVSADPTADKYAPVFYFEGEETCYPVDANYHLDPDTSDKKRLTDDGVEDINESTYNLNETDNIFYDNKHGTIDDDGVIKHYQSVEKNYGYTVYYRITNEGGNQVIQYWMFYAFNDGDLNKHEGDWEMVQVVIPNSGSKWVAYSQHHSGQRAPWDMVEKEDDHIKVYVARGSHANFLRSFSGKLGMSADIVGDNGKTLEPGDYQLKPLDDQEWIDFEGRWGEIGEDTEDAISGMFLGKIGPQGPKYRENGEMYNNPVSWGQNLPEASSLFFMLEWLVYNFITIFLLITAIILALTLFFIYRRHKKYGLGPRICSIFYIDGLNLKSIGNILCIVAVVIAIIALFTQWYGVSYDIYSEESNTDLGGLETEGTRDLLTIDGIKGLQVVIPGENGPTPMMSLLLPFSLFLGIGLAFLFLKAIGVKRSRKLGGKYIFRGIRIMIPVIIIVIGIISLGALVSEEVNSNQNSENYGSDLINSITSSPFGGSEKIEISEENFTGYFSLSWGLRQGGQMLILSGVFFIAAGVCLFVSNTVFFEPKIPYQQKRKKDKKTPPSQQNTAPMPPPPTDQQGQQTPPSPPLPSEDQPPQTPSQTENTQNMPPPPPPPESVEKEKNESKTTDDKTFFCTNCGAKIEEDSEFCSECGTKVEKDTDSDSKTKK